MEQQLKLQMEKYAGHYAGLLNTAARVVDPAEKELCSMRSGNTFCYCDVCRNPGCTCLLYTSDVADE